MCPVWLFDVIPGRHKNLGRLFMSFTIGIHICILKAKLVYSQAIFIYLFYQEHIPLLYRRTSYTCVGERGGGNTDVRARSTSGSGEGSQQLTNSQYFGSS